jgi:predicted ATPase/class 3 adenylate cyclase
MQCCDMTTDSAIGRVTLLFTDIEGSTRLWEEHPEGMAPALELHDELLVACVERTGGVVVKTMGDGLMAAFDAEADALSCALTGQVALMNCAWSLPDPLRVRMGIHTGDAIRRGDDFFGPTVNRTARLMGAGHGGQVLVSAATATALDPRQLVDLGPHRLRDLTAPEQIYQLVDSRLIAVHPRLRTIDLTPNNLPLELTSLVGRDDEIGATRDALQHSQLVTLTGFGGMGKTRLSMAVAASMVEHYADGVWFCPLAEASPTSVVNTIAGVLGVIQHADTDLLDSVCRVIADRTMLLVLDNCEHVIDVVRDVVRELQQRCRGLSLLATSREGLRTHGEMVVSVLPLATAVASDPGIALFVDRMRSTGAPDPGDAELEVISSLCQRLDGIPLAIELAAARTRSMTPADIDRRLGKVLGSTAIENSPAHRHATIGSAISWSHDLLSEPEQMLFRRLTVFAGGFDLEAAEAVCGFGELGPSSVWEHLDSLVVKSMVMPIPGRALGRYRMLEPLRDHGLERLQLAAEDHVVKEAHLDHFAAFGDHAVVALETPDEASTLHRYFADFANVRSANKHAVDVSDVDRGLRAVLPFASRAAIEYRFELYDWLSATMKLPGAFDHPSALDASAIIMGSMTNRAEEAPWAARVRALSGDDPPPFVQFGRAHYLGMDPELLLESIEKLRVIEPDDLYLEGQIRVYLSAARRRLDREAAVAEIREALDWAQSTGVGTLIAFASVVLAENLTWAGRGQEAYEAACEARTAAAAVGATWYETHAQLHMARSALFGAQTDEPVGDIFARVLRIARDSGSTHQQWTTIETVPHYFAAKGRLEEAAILVGGRTQSHLEWVHHGAQTQTPHLDLIPDDLLEQGRRTAQGMNLAGFVALATLAEMRHDRGARTTATRSAER